MKLLATSTPRKYRNSNQDINALGIKKHQILPPHLLESPPR